VFTWIEIDERNAAKYDVFLDF